MKKGFSYKVKNFFFPHICRGCRCVTDGAVLCPDCLDKWEKEKEAHCRLCRHSARSCECKLSPEGEKYSFELLRLADYKRDSVCSALVYIIKNRRAPRTIDFLSNELSRLALERKIKPGAIVTYAPRGKRAARLSGTDQAKALAQAFAEKRGEECISAVRRLASREQKLLASAGRESASARQYALADDISEKIAGKKIILIDDIVTTGATMCEIATLLRDAGADEVVCLCVGRTPK